MPNERPNRDFEYLHPILRARGRNALKEAQTIAPGLTIFEGWRSVTRQNYIYEEGRTRDGKKRTSAKGWQSWHQYGLAFDVALLLEGNTWSWGFDPQKVSEVFLGHGLEWGGINDGPHYQLTGGLSIELAKVLAINEGVHAVWRRVEDLLKG